VSNWHLIGFNSLVFTWDVQKAPYYCSYLGSTPYHDDDVVKIKVPIKVRDVCSDTDH